MTYEYTITVMNVTLTLPGPAEVDISWHRPDDIPGSAGHDVGVFKSDEYGFFNPPVVITLPDAGPFIIRAESCGCSFEKLFYAAIRSIPDKPQTPCPISGAAATCTSADGTYSVDPVDNATGYTWTVPAGWTITSGQGTTSITVKAGAAGSNGNITVMATGIGGNSGICTLAVTVNQVPHITSMAYPTNTLCPGQMINISAVMQAPGNYTYLWTVPVGWKITAGAGTAQIAVKAGSYGQDGNITVTAGNACGSDFIPSPMFIQPGPPNTTITGPASVNENQYGLVYTAVETIASTSYQWTVPDGWAITGGQGTNSVTVNSGPTAGAYALIELQTANSCGNTDTGIYVTVIAPPPPVNFHLSYTNNAAIHYQVYYGAGAPDTILKQGSYTGNVDVHLDAIPFGQATNIELILSSFPAGQTHLVSATMLVDGVAQPAPSIGTATANWSGIDGNDISISFITG